MPQLQIGVLWAGGWDDYIVDTDDAIHDPGTGGTDPIIYPAEMKEHGDCGDPHYVRALFSSKLEVPFLGKAVRVVKHLRGGD